MNLSEIGFEVVKSPIKQVRLQYHDKKWYVEYLRSKPKYFFDKWWWFDDSVFTEYTDAFVRAQVLAAEGGTKEIKPLSPQLFNVGT